MVAAKFNVKGGQFITKMGEQYLDVALDAFEKEAVNTVGKIIEDTPVGIPNSERYTSVPQGNLKHNWQIGRNPNQRVLKGSSNKGVDYASKGIRGKIKGSKRLVVFNNAPQARVVEFGGYPEPVKFGTYRKGRGYEVRSSRGYSKQAPKGMVRTNLAGFRLRLVNRLKKATRSVK